MNSDHGKSPERMELSSHLGEESGSRTGSTTVRIEVHVKCIVSRIAAWFRCGCDASRMSMIC